MSKSSPTPQAEGKTFVHDLGDMDLTAAAAAGAELELRHPASGAFLGIYINLCGSDSKTFSEAQRRIMDLAQKDGRKNVHVSVYERRASDLAAAVTLGWSYTRKTSKEDEEGTRVEGMIPWHGEELPYSDENAVNVYFERRWIREQIEAFIQVRENFFPG